jgi:hypothetical protein
MRGVTAQDMGVLKKVQDMGVLKKVQGKVQERCILEKVSYTVGE